MLSKTYFAFSRNANVFYLLDKWLNPYSFKQTIEFNNKSLTVSWTKRAEKILQKRESPLYVEMQLFFSCVVKKRVLFHSLCEHNSVSVTDHLSILFRPVEAASCDPVEFAKNFPERRELNSAGAIKMRARSLKIDFVNEQWVGEYLI